MHIRRFLALAGVLAALGLMTAAGALAAGPAVSVRVEGLKHTLLPTTTLHTGTGSITKGGTPSGTCPAASGAGALDTATHHNWNGTYSSGLGIEVTSILGETHRYSAKGYYWAIWVNNRFAQAGICDLKLHKGDQLLFAPYPGTGTTAPIVISVPGHVTAGHAFRVKATAYGTGKTAKPLAGVKITGGGVTNKQGVTTATAHHAGKLTLTATRTGYIRDEAAVQVAG
ncbi:MAG TPA: DUF4430 domain-containing protein [Solirubrobacteraceae bacterium]|nr:DUF4430 domain-containing protein [Solirubrobacteraceae bacterium]